MMVNSGGVLAVLVATPACMPNLLGSDSCPASMMVNSGGVLAVLVATPACMPNLLGSDNCWFILPMICAVMAAAHLLIAGRFPKSPKDLYIKERNEKEARAALDFFYEDHHDIGESKVNSHAVKIMHIWTFLTFSQIF
ncbi:unnamed protein product [Cylicostephanus goldi]|uniref:Major facilitator superfamily (MFS) profile domain-containing protein n=1 Tax=Cylicostephanus goldi TaxID=71465 RepID=A0A3P7MK69_CYLGO|nr:unnamed protein product [Cylicostephanus goldi]